MGMRTEMVAACGGWVNRWMGVLGWERPEAPLLRAAAEKRATDQVSTLVCNHRETGYWSQSAPG